MDNLEMKQFQTNQEENPNYDDEETDIDYGQQNIDNDSGWDYFNEIVLEDRIGLRQIHDTVVKKKAQELLDGEKSLTDAEERRVRELIYGEKSLTGAEERRVRELMRGVEYNFIPLTDAEERRVRELIYGKTTTDAEESPVHKNTEDFFSNILDLEPQCADTEFVDWLINRGVLEIERAPAGDDLIVNYRVRFLGTEFTTVNRTVEHSDQMRKDVRLYYDEWAKEKLKKTMRKSGIAVAVGLGLIALVTGLRVGLTRKGANIVHQAKKWEKLHRSRKTGSIPWTAIEKAGGKTIVFAGEYYLAIGAGAYLLLTRR